MYSTELSICGEIKLRVEQNLLSKETAVERVSQDLFARAIAGAVRAMARATTGCRREFLVSSNAEAARLAAQEPGTAAIAGEIAASIYGLGVLAAHIEDEPNNTTRFWVLGRQSVPPSGATRRRS